MQSLPRFVSSLLVLLFSYSLIGTALGTAVGTTQSTVPACCRNNGRHRCALSSHTAPGHTLKSPTCPLFPQSALTAARHLTGVLPAPQKLFGQHFAAPSSPIQTEARYRASFTRTRQKRGPPSISL